jgi:hypothetical protein
MSCMASSNCRCSTRITSDASCPSTSMTLRPLGTETRYGAKSWHVDRRVVARIEATTQGLDIRYVVTSFTYGSAEWLYDSLYCARGQAENLIKLAQKPTCL